MNRRLWPRLLVSGLLLTGAVACGDDDESSLDESMTTRAESTTTALDDDAESSDGGPDAPADPAEAGGSCVPPQDAFPVSSALEPGPTSAAYYDTVSPFEYADMERTHIHRADFYFGEPGEECAVSSRALEGLHESAYNIVTRDRDEAFVYGTDPEPYVVKFDLDTGEVVWETELPTIEDNFQWVGLVVVHGNGDVYAVHSRTMVRIDPDSGEIVARADLPPASGSAASDTGYRRTTGTLIVSMVAHALFDFSVAVQSGPGSDINDTAGGHNGVLLFVWGAGIIGLLGHRHLSGRRTDSTEQIDTAPASP